MEKKYKILVIDDDPDFIEVIKSILQSKAYDVIVATEGEQGLSKAKIEKPDLILLDVIMPIKDGFTVAEELKSDSDLKLIPLIMLTSFASRKAETSIAQSRGMTLEAEDYLDKPITPEELVNRVENQLKKHKTV